MNTYTSDLEYIDREVIPALEDYADDFNTRAIFHRMVEDLCLRTGLCKVVVTHI